MKLTRNFILAGMSLMLAGTAYGASGEVNREGRSVPPAEYFANYSPTLTYTSDDAGSTTFSKTTYEFGPESVTTNFVWSMSGKSYGLTEYAIFADPFVWKNVYLTYPVVAGVELDKQIPVTGLGVTLKYVQNRLFAEGGLYAIFGQKQKPDITFGFSAGIRF